MLRKDVEKYFSNLLKNDKNLSAGIAAIKTLLMVLEKSKCMSKLELYFNSHRNVLKNFLVLQSTPFKSYIQRFNQR